MVFLIDTCTLIWLGGPQAKVPLSVRTELARGDVRVSAISRVEIAIKQSKHGSFGVDFDTLIDRAGFQNLPFPVGAHRAYAALSGHHTETFDRLLVAHAIHDGCTLVTCDVDIRRYDVPTFW